MKVPIRRNTPEVDASWLEEVAQRAGDQEPPDQKSLAPPKRPSRIPKRPPALAGAAFRHLTMEVKAE